MCLFFYGLWIDKVLKFAFWFFFSSHFTFSRFQNGCWDWCYVFWWTPQTYTFWFCSPFSLFNFVCIFDFDHVLSLIFYLYAGHRIPIKLLDALLPSILMSLFVNEYLICGTCYLHFEIVGKLEKRLGLDHVHSIY